MFLKNKVKGNRKTKEEKKKEKITKKFNKAYAKKFTTIGGIVEKIDTIKCSNGYFTCLTIYEYETNVDDLWLLNFVRKYKGNDNNIIIKIDCDEYEGNIKNEINTSLNENNDVYAQTTKRTDQIDVSFSSANLEKVYTEVLNGNELIVNGQIRIYVFDKNENVLKEKVKDIITRLDTDGYKACAQIGKALEDYKAISNININLIQPFPCKTLANGFPYYASSLEDKNGSFLGFTNTNGTVSVNPYTKDSIRSSFDTWYFGDKGKGKTKSMIDDMTDALLRGYRAFVVDIEGEYLKLAEKYGGKVVSFGKSEFAYNFMQILKKSVDSSFEEDFRYHISKLRSMFFYLLDVPTETKISNVIKACKEVYRRYGYFEEENDIALLKVPKLEDVVKLIQIELDYLKDGKESIFKENNIKDLNDIVDELDKCIDPLMYGNIFNSYTKFNVQDEQFVVFDVSNVKRDTEKMASASMFLINQLMWNEMMKNRGNTLENGEPKFLVFYYDEAKNFVSPTVAIEHLKFIEDVSREDRKYECRQVFATQSIRDVCPKEQTKQSSIIESIFEQSTYRYFLGMDVSLVPLIRQLFPKIPYSYLYDIPSFGRGEMVLDIKGVTSVKFKHLISKEQLEIYE